MDYFLEKYGMESVLEKYIGKKPELIKIEKEMEKIVERVKKNIGHLGNMSGKETAHHINKSDENARIEKMFKKLFGLKEFVLNWVWTPIPDAHTMVKTFQFFDKNYGKLDDGTDYNSKLFIGVNISTGLITTLDINAKELVAIILHEIGHSFNRSIGHILAAAPPFILTKMGDSLKIVLLPGNVLSHIFYDFISINKIYTKLKRYVESFKNVFKPIMALDNFIKEYLMIIYSIIPKSIQLPFAFLQLTNPLRVIFLYDVERRSDDFAADYGYGKELASALNKLDRPEHPKMDIPVIRWIYDFDELIYEMIIEPLSGYPNMHTRQRALLDRLRKAAEDPELEPRTRKELKKQIKEFEDYYEMYMDLEHNENKKYILSWLYRRFVDKFFGGNPDVREFIYKSLDKNPYYRKTD